MKSPIQLNKNKKEKESFIAVSILRDLPSLTFNNQNEKEELDNIKRLMELETDTNSTNFEIFINFFIRKNPKLKNDIIELIIDFLCKNKIHYKAIIKCINSILELLIDNFQIINLLNNIIPILKQNLFLEENIKNLKAIHEISSFIGKLIKIGNTHIFALIEKITDEIFHDILTENSNETKLYACINLLSEIMKNSATISFNNIIVKKHIGNLLSLIEQNSCNKNEEIRKMSAEVTENFIGILKNRDSDTKKEQITTLYETLFNQFNANVNINNVNANNYFLINGFLLNIKKIFELYPILFNEKKLFTPLADSLMKLRNCGKNDKNIKLEFINFIPYLYKMNKKIFKGKYFKEYMKFSNISLNREKDVKIKYNLLMVLGELNYFEQEDIYKYSSVTLIPLIEKLLNGKDFLNEQVLKCLSDLLNNKAGVLSQNIILMINIFNLLPKIFKTPLNKYKVEFLISLINYFNYYSIENCSIVLLSLNTISQVICNEEFRLDHFLTFNEANSTSLISTKLTEIKTSINKDITKYLSDASFKDKNGSNYLDMISNLLNLFANIKNNLFYKDMLLFYYYKLIPMIKSYNKNINKQIINIAMCDFVNIDKNGENSSEFIIKNIIDAFINLFILNKESLPKEDLLNIFENKNIFIKILLKEKQQFFRRVLNLIDSSLYDNSKEFLIKIISFLEKNDKYSKSVYKNFTGNYIESLIFEIYNTKNKLYEEQLIVILLYLTIYFKHLFFETLYEKILNISILLFLRYENKDFIIINVLKIVNELLKNDNIKGRNISILNNILYIIAVAFFKESSINDYLSEYMLNMLLYIIKIEDIDIFLPIKFDIKDFIFYHRNNLNYNESKLREYYEKLIKIVKKIENINVIQLIYNHLLKCENENSSKLILKILGLSMTFSTTDFKNLNLNLNESSIGTEDKYILEDNQLKIKIYNKFSQNNIILNYPLVDVSGVKAILSLIELVKYHNKKDLKIKIIQNLNLIIQSIQQNETYYIDIILPAILQILPQYESKYQNKLFQNMTLIILNFREKSKRYIDDIILLIYDYMETPYLQTLYNFFLALFENYEIKMRKHYYRLIPKFINIIKKGIERTSYLKLLILISKSNFINPYIKLILSEIKSLIIDETNFDFLLLLLDLLKELTQKNDTYIFFPLIITILLRKIDLSFKKTILRKASRSENSLRALTKNTQNGEINFAIFNNFFEILDIMNNKYRNYFLLFLPKITSYFINNGLIDTSECRQKIKNYISYENEYTFMNTEKLKRKLSLDFCKINCFYAFNSFSIFQPSNTLSKTNKNMFDLDLEIINRNTIEDTNGNIMNFSTNKLKDYLIKNRESTIDNDLVIKSFDNSKCTFEKDWIEWYRKVNKSLLEQTPSKFIYIYHVITEYYFNMSFDLNLHSFLSVYNNNSDNNKITIIECLDKAIMDKNTPANIITAALNLIDFMAKRNVPITFISYEELGNIAYDCKAYTKALYYKEKGFEVFGNLGNVDNFIDIYYKLNVSENGIGLINLCEKDDRFLSERNYDKKYIWYINMHEYNKALEIINEKLSNPIIEQNELKTLKNYRNICFHGLCDWEKILTEEEANEIKEENENFNINMSKDIKPDKKINEEKIIRKLLLLKSCLALGDWDKLFKYMNQLKSILMEKEETKNNMELKEEDFTIKNEDYIYFNDLIHKNEFNFLKFDDSIFDLNIYATIKCLKDNNIDIARKLIDSCQKMLINKLRVLIKESYTTSNDAFLKNQCLQQLEHYCDYKQYHLNDKQYYEQMKSKIKLLDKNLSQDPEIYTQYIAINSLIFPIEELYCKYLNLSTIYRKCGQFIQAEKILKILKKKLNINDNYMDDKKMIFDEKRIKIELCYNKCIFAKGNVDKAADNLKKLIDLLKDNDLSSYNNLGNKMKSKIYGNYAIYKLNQLFKTSLNNKIQRQKSEIIKSIFSKNISNYLKKQNLIFSYPKKEESDKIKRVKFDLNEKISLKNYIKENEEKGKNDTRSSFYLRYVNEEDDAKVINDYLRLATEFNNDSYKYWHYFATFNYKVYRFIYNQMKGKNDNNQAKIKKVIEYANNSINGLKHSLLIANKSKVRALEDSLRFIDIFFELGNKDKNLLSQIEAIINEADLEIFISIIPQLTCRFDIKDKNVLEILIKLLSNILTTYPEVILFPLISIKNSKTKRSKAIVERIMQRTVENNIGLKELYQEYEEFVKELNKCALLYHEEWIETIETSAKLYLNKNYNNMVSQLIQLHNKIKKPPESLYEINFYQLYGNDLKKAEKILNKFQDTKNLIYLKEAWAIYQKVYKSIKENYSNFQSISLQYISSKLFNFKDSNIIIPSFSHSFLYKSNENNNNNLLSKRAKDLNQTNIKPITIKQIHKYLYILDSKQHSRKISMIGTNNKEYIYLLKGYDDLRQDERVIQIFNLVNLIMSKEKTTSNLKSLITIYSVIPLSNKSGLIGWVPDCDSLEKLIKEYTKINNKIPNKEKNTLLTYNPGYETSSLLFKVDAFLHTIHNTSDINLRQIIWLKSKDCESWFIRTTNYARSLAVMSIVGYILGLGDRHPNNILMNRETGKIVHIDLGDCFEIAMKRDKFPEKVPFRLTRMLVRALGITEVEGNFRITCEKTLFMLKYNRDSLIAILSALVHNPLISFKLLIPLIMKKRRGEFKIEGPVEDKDIAVLEENASSIKKIEKKNNKRLSNYNKNIIENKTKEEDIEGKDERQIMEREQRQIFSLFEETDDIDSDELYKIAQLILVRINNKLIGIYHINGVQLNEKEHVELLIKEARSYENLVMSYLGWAPYW